MITVTNLTHIKDDTDSTSYGTPSISPVTGTVIFVWVYSVDAAASPHPTPSLSGNGITWNQLQTLSSGSFIGSRGTLFWALVPGGSSSGSITISFSSTVFGVIYSVDQIAAGAGNGLSIRQSQIATVTAANPSTILATTPLLDSVIFGYVGKPNSGAFTGGSGFTLLNNDNAASEARSAASEYKLSSTSTTVDFTGAGNTDLKIAAAEVQEIFQPVANITDAAGDLSSSATTLAVGSASLPGLGDLAAFVTVPLCQFPYIAYDYGGAFFCIANLGAFSSPTHPTVRNLCIVRC